MWLRARAGGTRDRYLSDLNQVLPQATWLSPSDDDLTLLGGIDVAASLSAGRRMLAEGLLAQQGPWVLGGAERASLGLAARIAQAVDAGRGPVVAIDEGAEPDEALCNVLANRLGLFVDLDGLRPDNLGCAVSQSQCLRAQKMFPETAISPNLETVLVAWSGQLGVFDPRLLCAARAAGRAIAALDNRRVVNEQDIELAFALVVAPRGACVEDMQPEVEKAEEEDPIDQDDARTSSDPDDQGVKDQILEAAEIALPSALLDLSAKAPRRTAGTGAGGTEAAWARGRPLPSRHGRYQSGRRIDPISTIRAALPWQRLRAASPAGHRLSLRPSDLRIKRYQKKTGRVVIFTVDASGSQAMARMAEAKGAVECLLAEAYRSRDEVALIAFRGTSAELLLPPTGALVRARSALQSLPAGGGTPLAAGLLAAKTLAQQVQNTGKTAVLVLLSDGRANVALNGEGNRTSAQSDAEVVALALQASRVESLVLDTGRRPEPGLADLAHKLSGRYVAMPHGTAMAMSAAVADALGD